MGGIDYDLILSLYLRFPWSTNENRRRISIAGLWTQTCTRDICNKQQGNENYALCLSRDQNAGQTKNESIGNETFEISAKIKYLENYNNIRISLSRISSKKIKSENI
jgi:hypothetical protein